MATIVDWEEQWAMHASDFRGGFAHVSLPNKKIIQLLPGPGFGDYSHPTTQLMIEMMPPYVEGKAVFDIGCGSGILSIAAFMLGALQVSWVDIDPESEKHTRQNAQLNNVVDTPLSCPSTILMNMIASEQSSAWSAHGKSFDTLITSGILTSQKASYLAFASSQNWSLVEERQLGKWSGFIFKETL